MTEAALLMQSNAENVNANVSKVSEHPYFYALNTVQREKRK